MFDNRVIVLGPVEYTFCGETYFTGFQALTLIICGDSPAYRGTVNHHLFAIIVLSHRFLCYGDWDFFDSPLSKNQMSANRKAPEATCNVALTLNIEMRLPRMAITTLAKKKSDV